MSKSSISTPRILTTAIQKKSAVSIPRILVTVVPSTAKSFYFDTAVKESQDIEQTYDIGVTIQQDISINADTGFSLSLSCGGIHTAGQDYYCQGNV